MTHTRNRKNQLIFGMLLCALLWLPAGLVRAAAADYTVEEGKDGDGSEADPFGSVKEALEEISEHGGKTILVRAGKYDEAFTLPKGVSLLGEKRDEVWIRGSVRMEHDSEVRNLSFTGRGNIIVSGNADVVIKNIHIKDVALVGIIAEVGDGKLSISDSVIEGARKGLYIQKGRELVIKDSEVSSNREEGLDIRNQVSGSITESRFRDNNESGIEVILGASKILIRSNTFKGNGSSGIATQFLSGEDRKGDVRIEDNGLEGSSNYGIDCRIPGGGPPAGDYFLNSLRIEGNTYKSNRKGDIAPRCKLLTEEESRALAEEEAAAQALEAKRLAPLFLSETELSQRTLAAAADRQAYDDLELADEESRVGQALGHLDAALTLVEGQVAESRERSSLACVFLGRDIGADRAFGVVAEDAARVLGALEREEGALRFDENRRVFRETLVASRARLAAMETERNLLPACRFSLLGPVLGIFAKRAEIERVVPEETWAQASIFPVGIERKMLLLGTLSWTPLVRNQVAQQGDLYLFSQVREDLRQYDTVVADIALPILNDADPVPPAKSVRAVSFPSRFANIFSANNIRLFNTSALAWRDLAAAKLLEKTEANLRDAGGETFGSAGKSMTRILGSKTVVFFGYHENETERLEAVLTEIAQAKQSADAVIVYVAWKGGPTAPVNATRSAEQRVLFERLTAAGANIVIGTGEGQPRNSEDINGARVYYSLGDMFPSVSSLERVETFSALVIGFDQSGSLMTEERKGGYDAQAGFTFSDGA
jgi:hypothetical protein